MENIENRKDIREPVCIALGEDGIAEDSVELPDDGASTASITDPLEYCKILEERIYHMTNAMDSAFAIIKEIRNQVNIQKDREITDVIKSKKNDEVIPTGTVLTGNTKGVNYFCQVKEDGFYVGVTKYPSLSAAAEGVSGVRRSGWTFWKLPNEKTVKEVYKE